MDALATQVSYTIRAEELGWGCLLMAISLVIHGFGMVLTLHVASGVRDRLSQRNFFMPGLVAIIVGSWLIMFTTILEVAMWSAFLTWRDCFPNFSTATYFAALQYTTVGSALNLPKHWRLLEPMIASAGLLGFAWSTGVLMTLAQEFQEQQLRRLREAKGRLLG